MAVPDSLYMGFDLSTQQLKGIVINESLTVVHQAKFDLETDAKGYSTVKGVLSNEAEHEVFAPVTLWLQALDVVLQKLKDQGLDFSKVRRISSAGMQHGSVFWGGKAEKLLANLSGNPDKSLEDQLQQAFSFPYSPNWQDASTQRECDEFDRHLGNTQVLADVTGSKAHHRFTGPQILRFRRRHPQEYRETSRISLVSSFLASVFLGKVAQLDISDICGMNLWDVRNGQYCEELLQLVAGSEDTTDLFSKLGEPDFDVELGPISPYFVQRYGFSSSCIIAPSTGDNPATILALPLRPLDAIVSLGTSTTFLMSTPQYKPDPSVHFFNHPTTSGLCMFMYSTFPLYAHFSVLNHFGRLCYKNGGLAREQVRNSLLSPNAESDGPTTDPWRTFNDIALATPPMDRQEENSRLAIGLYFPRPEIVPNVSAGIHRFNYDPKHKRLYPFVSFERTPFPIDNNQSITYLPVDARLILESQLLSLRLRSQSILSSPTNDRAQNLRPRRIYLVGGGSHNPAIARLAGEILGPTEGVWKLDVGENACALGAAQKALWSDLKYTNGGNDGDGEGAKINGQSFEDFLQERWQEEKFARKVDVGYRRGLWEDYQVGVEGLKRAEEEVLRMEGKVGLDL